MEHTGFVCLFTYTMCEEINSVSPDAHKLNTGKALKKAIVHDIDEVITGDIPRPTKYYNDDSIALFEKMAEAGIDQIIKELNVEGLEDCELLAIHRDAQEELYRRIPKFERFFRIKVMNSFIALRSRIMSNLQKSGKERYLEFYDQFPELQNRIANYHIANYLGIKPESLSRIRKELI